MKYLMRAILGAVCRNFEPDTPKVVKDAMLRLQDRFNNPPRPIMTQEEFEALPKHRSCFLICNVIDCKNVVCTHGLLCLEHTLESEERNHGCIH